MPLLIEIDRFISITLWWCLKAHVEANGRSGEHALQLFLWQQDLTAYVSFIPWKLASSIFSSFPFLWHGLSPQLSAHWQRGSQGRLRSSSDLAPNSRAEEWVNKQITPAKTKWSLWVGLWPPVTKYKEVANRGLTQKNIDLFIRFTVSRMCAVYYIPEGRQVWKAWGGTLWWKTYFVKYICWAAHLRGGHCVPRRKTLKGHLEVPASHLGIIGRQCWRLVHRVFIASGTQGRSGL